MGSGYHGALGTTSLYALKVAFTYISAIHIFIKTLQITTFFALTFEPHNFYRFFSWPYDYLKTIEWTRCVTHCAQHSRLLCTQKGHIIKNSYFHVFSQTLPIPTFFPLTLEQQFVNTV